MIELKTDEALLERLRKSAKREYREGEAEEQRISFIYSGLPDDITMTKEEIRKMLRYT